MDMATYAIGDIHGQIEALKTLIKKLNLKKEDHVIFLGDYVGRKSQWLEVLKYAESLKSVCRITKLWGNHEKMLYDHIERFKSHRWSASLLNRFDDCFHGTGGEFLQFEDPEQKYVSQFFKDMQFDISIETKKYSYVLCHALPKDVGYTPDDSIWGRLMQNENLDFTCDVAIDKHTLFNKYAGKTIVHGHTPVLLHYENNSNIAPNRLFKYKIQEVSFIDIDLGAKLFGRYPNANLCALRLEDQTPSYAA